MDVAELASQVGNMFQVDVSPCCQPHPENAGVGAVNYYNVSRMEEGV